jgi:hypothetical protein
MEHNHNRFLIAAHLLKAQQKLTQIAERALLIDISPQKRCGSLPGQRLARRKQHRGNEDEGFGRKKGSASRVITRDSKEPD